VDATVPSPGGPLLCGQVVAGRALCGESRAADLWVNVPFNLLPTTAEVIVPIEVTITIDATGYLNLLGGVIHVNPVLMPFVCIDLDLDAITCTPLDLTPVSAEALDLDPVLCEAA
jgi:hypothetical protein